MTAAAAAVAENTHIDSAGAARVIPEDQSLVPTTPSILHCSCCWYMNRRLVAGAVIDTWSYRGVSHVVVRLRRCLGGELGGQKTHGTARKIAFGKCLEADCCSFAVWSYSRIRCRFRSKILPFTSKPPIVPRRKDRRCHLVFGFAAGSAQIQCTK